MAPGFHPSVIRLATPLYGPGADVKACLHLEGTCPSQKLSLSRLPNQSLPDVNCDIEKVLSEFYLQAYILLKQHPE